MSNSSIVEDIVSELLTFERGIKMEKGWTATMKEFFGLNGKTLKEFSDEIKALTFEVRMEFWKMLQEAGFPCKEPMLNPGQQS